jgi:hypothetical protein
MSLIAAGRGGAFAYIGNTSACLCYSPPSFSTSGFRLDICVSCDGEMVAALLEVA